MSKLQLEQAKVSHHCSAYALCIWYFYGCHQVQANVNGVDSPRQNVVVSCMWVHKGSTDNNYNVCQRRVCNRGHKAPKFTLSRKQCTDEHGVAGIGWTKNGMNKFNDMYDLVKEDRTSQGETFNAELFNVFVERQRIVKSNPHRAITRKRKTIP
jgi:hypothetical protein